MDDRPSEPPIDARNADPTIAPSADAGDPVDVYWRPGCPFCAVLFADLRRRRIPVRRHNIWDDPEAAAFVRSVADGNETVPTVTVGDVSVVNPRGRVVADLYRARTACPPTAGR